MIVTPIIGGVALGLAIRSTLPPTDSRPIGLIDQVQALAGAETQPDGPVEVIFFRDTQLASQALQAG